MSDTDGNVNEDRMPDVLHAVGLGVADLRAQVAQLDRDLAESSAWGGGQEARANRLTEELKDARAHYDEKRREVWTLTQTMTEDAKRFDGLIREFDALAVGLSALVGELKGRTQTGKTKAERVALGHVLARIGEFFQPARDSDGAPA